MLSGMTVGAGEAADAADSAIYLPAGTAGVCLDRTEASLSVASKTELRAALVAGGRGVAVTASIGRPFGTVQTAKGLPLSTDMLKYTTSVIG